MFDLFFRDLEGVEKFSSTLEELILDNNEISEKTVIPQLEHLKLLSLCNNHVSFLY